MPITSGCTRSMSRANGANLTGVNYLFCGEFGPHGQVLENNNVGSLGDVTVNVEGIPRVMKVHAVVENASLHNCGDKFQLSPELRIQNLPQDLKTFMWLVNTKQDNLKSYPKPKSADIYVLMPTVLMMPIQICHSITPPTSWCVCP